MGPRSSQLVVTVSGSEDVFASAVLNDEITPLATLPPAYKSFLKNIGSLSSTSSPLLLLCNGSKTKFKVFALANIKKKHYVTALHGIYILSTEFASETGTYAIGTQLLGHRTVSPLIKLFKVGDRYKEDWFIGKADEGNVVRIRFECAYDCCCYVMYSFK